MSVPLPHAFSGSHVHHGAMSKVLPLTSLRFFAALYVVLYHTGTRIIADASRALGLSTEWLTAGYISVSFFFILSGYILAIVYLKNGQPVDKHRFWTARFARVYPLYFLALTLDVPYLVRDRLAQHFSMQSTLLKGAMNYVVCTFMLQAWLPRPTRVFNYPGWSLSVEAIFYLLFPWIGTALWRLSRRASVVTAIAIYAASTFLVWTAMHAHLHEDIVKYNPMLHLGEFSLGILLAKLHMALNRSYAEELRKASLAMTAVGMVLLVFSITFSGRLPAPYLNDGLLFPVFGCIILAVASGSNVVTRLLSMPLLVLLGEASYALYLLHVPLWHLAETFHLAGRETFYPVYLISCISLSILSFHWLEAPLRKAILHRFATASKETVLTSSIAQ